MKLVHYLMFLAALALISACHQEEEPQIIKSNQKQILNFAFKASDNKALEADVMGEINETNNSIAFSFANGTDITALKPSINISDLASINPLGDEVQNFTDPVVYAVTAEDASVKEYTVTVSIAKKSEKEILEFSFLAVNNESLSQDAIATIDQDAAYITVTLPYNGDVSRLVPTIVISDGATVSPGNEEIRGFYEDNTYTVTAEDGSSLDYIVNVTVEDPLTVDSFEPISAKVGATVTITGTKFSEVSEENHVFFNHVAADVISSTSTTITVIVPQGATTGKITVYTDSFEYETASLDDFTVLPLWEQIANFVGDAREKAFSFSINGKGYVGGGYVSNDVIDMWEYDATTNSWTQKADFAGGARTGEATFSIGNKGYIATGYRNWNNTTDLWEYNSETNTWTSKTNFPGAARNGGVGFAIGNKGYLGLGSGIDGYYNDFYEYDPSTDLWTQIADFNGAGRASAVSFSIGQKGYVSTGVDENNVQFKDLWEYDQSTNQWAQKSDFGGTERQRSIGFSLNGKGYITTGIKQQSGAGPKYFSDFWEYNPATDEWMQKEDFKGGAQFSSVGFVIANKAYIGTGVFDDGSRDRNEFWVFDSEK